MGTADCFDQASHPGIRRDSFAHAVCGLSANYLSAFYFSMHRLFIILLALTASAAAKEVRLTPQSVGTYAVAHNPSLAAARLRIEEARGRLQNAGRFSNPEAGSAFDQNFRSAERSFEASFTQRFPITARLRLEKEVSRAELAAAEEEVRDEERKLMAQALTAVVRLLALDAQQALRDTQIANSRQISEFTRNRVETAEASITDVTLVDLEIRQLETEVLLLGVERTTFRGELRLLLGLTPGDEIALRGSLPPVGAMPVAGVNVGARPDFQAAQAAVAAARSGVELERARKWDDISVGLARTSEYSEDAPEGFERDEFWGLRFSLPLPLWNANEGKIREAAAVAARRAKEADALALTIRTEADATRSEMAALAKVIGVMDEALIPMATQVEEQLRASQSTGQATLIEVLRARDRRFQLQRQRLDALRDFHLARVRHDAATARNVYRSSVTNTTTRRGK